MRAPHHSASAVALVGGGSPPQPGEASLAHAGVLFLDELPEFPRAALEALREALETGQLTISRAGRQAQFPARFQLVAAMNPCPCGHLGDARHSCRCTPAQVQRYRARISGPLLDRIDLHTEAPALTLAELRNSQLGETSSAMRGRIEAARHRQLLRFAGGTGTTNARMGHAQIRRHCAIDARLGDLLQQAMEHCASPREPTTAFSRSLARSLTSLAPT